MCGRSSLTKTEKELEQRFGASFYSDELLRYNPLPNFNVAPTHYHPVITEDDIQHLQLFKWGLVPFWAKDEKIGSKMINAKIETILEKPAFKSIAQTQRCLVPFDGFYEWKLYPDKHREPYRITVYNGEIFSVAGLWSSWQAPNGEIVKTFTLITQPPNQKMAEIHNRMPAILNKSDEAAWLDKGLSGTEALQLIMPFPDDEMQIYRVSDRINKVSNNDSDLIKAYVPTEKDQFIQGSLF